MRVFVCTTILILFIQCTVIGKKMKTTLSRRHNIQNDAVLEVEPLPPDVSVAECSCVCCDRKDEPLERPKCHNDIVVAVDSSACFRDHHSRMMRFLKKLVRRIARTEGIQYGSEETRLALMQFSSDIIFPLKLSSFENYTNPSTKKGLMEGINQALEELRFLGEGAFLNKALNTTVDHIGANPRPNDTLKIIGPDTLRPIVILITNGKSHPTVTMDDIEYSIADLESAGITVVPVSVTRECHGIQSDTWNEGLCPDTVTLNKLAKIGRSDASSFLEMTSHETLADIVNILKCGQKEGLKGNSCNNCTCSCELPVGPPGQPGPRGVQGDFVKGGPGEKGEPGSKGEDGKLGEKGQKGDEGVVGEKGDLGEKGENGTTGEKGDRGEDGMKGNVGEKGDEGEPGSKGTRGRKGEDGEKGEVGVKGDIGEKGETGRNGSTGVKGEPGAVGPKGEEGVGEKGEPGNPGDSGPPGPRGGIGQDGSKGNKGNNGLCGKPGPAGRKGMEGLGGADGIDGLPGPPGEQGLKGEPGVSGDKGQPGPLGLPGINGRIGPPGERGPAGPEGKTGTKGEKGEPSTELGPRGLPGEPGSKGMKGTDGTHGSDGRQGVPGRQGPMGKQGIRGPAGQINVEDLRPIITDIVRELLPGVTSLPPKDECIEIGVDVTFLVDGSDSISQEDFIRIKEWILSTVDAIQPFERKIPTNINVVQFSEKIVIEVSQPIVTNSSEISEEVHSIEQMRSGTKTYSAIKFVNEKLHPNMTFNSAKVLITITDGDASEDRDGEVISEAMNNFDLMVAVGVGSRVDADEMNDFSTRGNIFHIDNFAQLNGILPELIKELMKSICRGNNEDPSPPDDGDEEPAPPDDLIPISTTPVRNDGDDICSQQQPTGNCNNEGEDKKIAKYYWNSASKSCTFFMYRKCPGGNVFDTEEECLSRCGHTMLSTITTIEPVIPVEPGCYRAVTDLAFVIDGSASVGKEGFTFLKSFLKAAISEFYEVGIDGLQVAIIQYNEEPRLEFDFTQTISKKVVFDAVDNMTYLSGNTRTGHALEHLDRTYDNLNQSRSQSAKRVAVVVTDGRSQDEVKGPAAVLKEKGVTLFAIGVGDAVQVELQEIASETDDYYIYDVEDYLSISTIKDSVVERICEQSEGIYKAHENILDVDESFLPVTGNDAESEREDFGSGDNMFRTGRRVEET